MRLFSGNPNEEGIFFPSRVLEDAYLKYFRDQGYQPHPKGLPAARRAIADYYLSRNAAVDPENLILTTGTSESFSYVFSLLARPGENILTPNPAYPLFDHIASLSGLQLRHYALREENRWSIDFEDVRSKTDERTKAIVLISPNNPTGHVASEGEILELIDWANRKGLAVVCDEVFCEFFFGNDRFPRPMTVAKPDLCFTLNGISKMFALPALKLGWIAVTGKGPLVADAVDRLETTADTFLSCHTPIQTALPEIFKEGRAFLGDYVAEVNRRRGLAIDLLGRSRRIRFVEPRGGFYLTAAVETDLSEERFVVELMRQRNVFVHPGYFFDYERGVHAILSYLVRPDRMERGLKALLDFLS